MIYEEEKGKRVLEQFETLKSDHNLYEPVWQEIRELVRPSASDFYVKMSQGQVRSTTAYDDTPVQACSELSAAITSHTTSLTDRWFSFELEDPDLNRDPDAIEWLEKVADIIYSHYANPLSKFYPSIYESNSDLAAFGTSAVYQEWNQRGGHLTFKARPLSSIYIGENERFQVDRVACCFEYTSRQVQQAFPKAVLPDEITLDTKNAKRWEVVHWVHPRADRNPGSYTVSNKEFESCWVLKSKGLLLEEGGYDSLPYHVARWSTMAGEVYGRGPAIQCLPSIRLLNRQQYTLIKAGERAVLPPLLVENEGVVLPIKLGPDSINLVEPGMDNPIRTLDYRGNIPITFEMVARTADMVRRAFFSEWVKLGQKNERQTAYEISERVDEQLRMMGAVTGRLWDETHSPMLTRSYSILKEKGKLPPPPAVIEGSPFKIISISNAARAQISSKATQMGRYIQELAPVAQIDPTVFDAIDMKAYAQELARLRGVSRLILRKPKDIQAMEKKREQDEQMKQMAGAMEPMSKSVKNLSEANATGSNPVASLLG